MILAERCRTGYPTPNISRLPDGRWFTAFAEGKDLKSDQVDDPWVPERLMGQYGQGEPLRWEEPRPLMELPMGIGVWNGALSFVDRAGDIHLIGLRFVRWARPVLDLSALRADLWHSASRDGGATWEPPKRVDFGRSYTGACNSIIQISSGRILVPLSYLAPERPSGMYVSKVVYSDDGGRTWYHDSTDLPLPVGGQYGESGAIEPVVVELNDGRVWMVIRTQYGVLYQSCSEDGRVWTEPAPTRFKASNAPAQVYRLRDGRLVLVWNHSVGPPFHGDHISYARHVLNAAVSSDDGSTWQGYREFVRLRPEDGVHDHVRYPMIVEQPDGKLLVNYNCVRVEPRESWWEYVQLDPDRLTETHDREDFAEGLAGWSVTGTAGVETAAVDGGVALRMQRTGRGPLGATRNCPYGPRGTLRFEVLREEGASGLDLVLNETFLTPSAREEPGSINVALHEERVPSGSWLPVTVGWDVADRTATARVGNHEWQVLITLGPGGISYLTLYGRHGPADPDATLLRALDVTVKA